MESVALGYLKEQRRARQWRNALRVAWLVFLLLLWGRHRQGWRGPVAVRTLYIGSALLLLAYVGSRFVLEVLLGRMPAA